MGVSTLSYPVVPKSKANGTRIPNSDLCVATPISLEPASKPGNPISAFPTLKLDAY